MKLIYNNKNKRSKFSKNIEIWYFPFNIFLISLPLLLYSFLGDKNMETTIISASASIIVAIISLIATIVIVNKKIDKNSTKEHSELKESFNNKIDKIDNKGNISEKVKENIKIITDIKDVVNSLNTRQKTKDEIIGKNFNDSIQSIINLDELKNKEIKNLISKNSTLEKEKENLELQNKILRERLSKYENSTERNI